MRDITFMVLVGPILTEINCISASDSSKFRAAVRTLLEQQHVITEEFYKHRVTEDDSPFVGYIPVDKAIGVDADRFIDAIDSLMTHFDGDCVHVDNIRERLYYEGERENIRYRILVSLDGGIMGTEEWLKGDVIP